MRPYLPFPNDFILKDPIHNSCNLSLALRPKAFSAKSLVRLSGVSIPCNLTRCFLNQTPNPRSK